MRHVILDTDIGSDVDDALALALLLGSPEVDIVGVTTVYGDTLLRARLAAKLLTLARVPRSIPCVPGLRQPLSGRAIWWAGHEGQAFVDLAEQRIDTSMSAPEFLVEQTQARPGEIDVVAIGPLTNIASAVRMDAEFATNVRSLIVMGGHFTDDTVGEHNFKCDATAAAEVFACGANMVVTGLDVTTQVRLDSEEVRRIADSGPLGDALGQEIKTWWAFHGNEWNNPHDPVTALTLLDPEAFGYRGATISVDQGPAALGVSHVRLEDPGTVRLAADFDADRVRQGLLTRITAA